MNDFTPDEQQRRDGLLLSLLKNPPQPRPKRDREKTPTKQDREKPATERKPEPST